MFIGQSNVLIICDTMDLGCVRGRAHGRGRDGVHGRAHAHAHARHRDRGRALRDDDRSLHRARDPHHDDRDVRGPRDCDRHRGPPHDDDDDVPRGRGTRSRPHPARPDTSLPTPSSNGTETGPDRTGCTGPWHSGIRWLCNVRCPAFDMDFKVRICFTFRTHNPIHSHFRHPPRPQRRRRHSTAPTVQTRRPFAASHRG